MNTSLDETSRLALIQHRMERADETMEEALLLCNAAHYNAAMNRLYYACFYAITAALLQKDINSMTHTGTKAMFSLHFIASGVLPKEHGKTFSRLFEIRHTSDYDDFVYCDKELFDDFFPKAQSLIESLREYVKANNINA